MDKAFNLEYAEELLRSHSSFVGEKNPNAECGAYFAVKKDDNEILVYNADFSRDTFYWTEEIVDITRALKLSFFITRERIQIGLDLYGNPIMKEVVAARIY